MRGSRLHADLAAKVVEHAGRRRQARQQRIAAQARLGQVLARDAHRAARSGSGSMGEWRHALWPMVQSPSKNRLSWGEPRHLLNVYILQTDLGGSLCNTAHRSARSGRPYMHIYTTQAAAQRGEGAQLLLTCQRELAVQQRAAMWWKWLGATKRGAEGSAH